jgi:putative phosphoribosyl transferase
MARHEMTAQRAPTGPMAVRIPMDGAWLDADLTMPPTPCGLVIFAHGSGSGRKSARNQAVAQALQLEGMATLLLDLLTADEERVDRLTAEHRFDIPLLASRLERAMRWAEEDVLTRGLPIGLFGASTGAAAALMAAADHPMSVGAVVSRGGRPDLAGRALGQVRAPTLLIIGSRDEQVLALNAQAALQMRNCTVETEVVRGATHLFEEPGTLEQVSRLAAHWFRRHLEGARTA